MTKNEKDMTTKILTQEFLKSIFDYKDGILYNKRNVERIKFGKKVGTINSKGYISTVIHEKRYYVHRLIFMIHHGFLPKNIDHIDGNKANNKIENLRPASYSENNMNTKARSSSGVKNIYFDKRRNIWNIQLRINNKLKFFGSFNNLEYAKIAAKEARNKYHGEFANHG
jgi:hypothetical protein